MNRGKRLLTLLLVLLLILPVFVLAEETPAPTDGHTAEPEPTLAPAENVSRQCSFKSNMKGFYLKYLRDNDFDTFNYVSTDCPLVVELKDSGAKYLCIAWEIIPATRVIRFWGEEDSLLSEVSEAGFCHDETFLMPEGTVRLEISASGEERISVAEVLLYTEGTLPEPWYYTWEPTPEKLDFLIIGTHFDDEVLYLGAVMPIYGAEKGYTGTFLHMTYQLRMRLDESLRGDWTTGTRYYPLFAMLPDVYKETSRHAEEYSEEIVTKTLVRYYRQYKPNVIFTQDTQGEYGHWQHVQTVKCALAAIPLAADNTYDPESVEAYGTWQVQKAYTHIYPEGKITLDTRTPLTAFDGMNALEVAQAAYKKHVSQITAHAYEVRDDYKYSIADFGLAYSAVDDPGEDVFDGIDESLFVGYVSPTPTPSSEPTPEPTPTPTSTPVPTTVPADTPAPTEEVATETNPPSQLERGNVQWLILAGIGVLLIGLFAYVLVLVNRHKQTIHAEKEE